MRFQAYKEADYGLLCDFFVALNRQDDRHINWNWARLEWMIGHPEFDSSLSSAIGLWLEADRVVGAAVYDMYFGEAFCGVLPGYEALYPELLDYAYRHLKDEAGLGIALCDDCPGEIAAAKAAGFLPAEQTETVMLRRLDQGLSAPLPQGLSLRELDQTADSEALAWLFWQGFDHGSDRAEFERTETVQARPRPHFSKSLALAAVTEGGEPVSACCLWLLPGTDYAYVEPVCTVPAWRGRGAAKALLFEAMRRAKALGANRAYVISDQRFYERLGFEKRRHYSFYWKP